MTENRTLAAALSYHAAGLSLIPIRADGSKAPDGAWKHFQQMRPTAEQLKQWFGNGTAHGIGLVHGAVSGNSEVLDFDEPGLYDQFAEIAGEQGYGELLDSLPLVETPSGGRHLLYRCASPISGNTKLAETQGRKTRIETRGEGGYTLAPGSPAECHPDGRPYLFLRGRPSTIPTITAEDRTALLNIALLFNEYVDTQQTVDSPPQKKHGVPSDSEGTRTGELRPGDDYNRRGDYEALLEGRGWRRMAGGGDRGLWQRPGKTGRGLSATSNYGGAGLFYVFSSNAAPFEPQKAYSPFSVFALLEQGGDFAAAARELGRQRYGQQQREERQAQQTAEHTPEHVIEHSAVEFPSAEFLPLPDPAMFYGLAGDIVRVIEPHTEADPVALLVQLMVAFGSSIGRYAHFRAEADRHYGNLYAVLIGKSSKARKGTSWGYIRRLFVNADPEWAGTRIVSGLSSGEGLIWQVRDPIEKQMRNKKTGDYETEIEDHGIADKRLLVQEGEFANVLKVMGREGSTLSPILRNGWDTGSLQSLTKNSPARATGAHLSVVGHITADELRRELSSTEAGNGFGNRFLWFFVRRSKELPEGGNLAEGALTPVTLRLRSALEQAKLAGEMIRDQQARAVWLSVYSALSAEQPGLFGAVTSRGEAQVMRFAMLYALLDGDDAIRRPHMLAALALWEYVEASARYVFGDSMGDNVADEILRVLRADPAGRTRDDLRQHFQRNQSSGRIDQALALLSRHGRIAAAKEQTGGRPAERWFAIEHKPDNQKSE